MQRVLRFSINTFSGLGGGLAAASILYSFQGQPRAACLFMMAAVLIDAVDGTLVRVLQLDDVLPRYDGERLDEYADLITFVVAPVAFAWGIEVLPRSLPGLLTGILICVVSILQFSHQTAKTRRAFWGWPSYWNILFFYGWALEIAPAWMMVVSWLLSLGVFVPVPFVYPTRFPRLRWLTMGLGGVWLTMLLTWILSPDAGTWLLHTSLFYPLYYASLTVIFYKELVAEV